MFHSLYKPIEIRPLEVLNPKKEEIRWKLDKLLEKNSRISEHITHYTNYYHLKRRDFRVRHNE